VRRFKWRSPRILASGSGRDIRGDFAAHDRDLLSWSRRRPARRRQPELHVFGTEQDDRQHATAIRWRRRRLPPSQSSVSASSLDSTTLNNIRMCRDEDCLQQLAVAGPDRCDSTASESLNAPFFPFPRRRPVPEEMEKPTSCSFGAGRPKTGLIKDLCNIRTPNPQEVAASKFHCRGSASG